MCNFWIKAEFLNVVADGALQKRLYFKVLVYVALRGQLHALTKICSTLGISLA
jgi:hypothetical protein